MPKSALQFTAESLAKSMLERRAELQKLFESVSQEGRLREVKQCAALMQRMDKMIDKYGLDRLGQQPRK